MPLTPNNREEYWLQGMVDGQTTLEPNKRREYWYKEIVDAIGSGGGGGTGGGVLVATITKDKQAMTMTLDKTYNEIIAAPFTVVTTQSVSPSGEIIGTTAFVFYTHESNALCVVYVANIEQDGTIKTIEFSANSPDEPLVYYMG